GTLGNAGTSPSARDGAVVVAGGFRTGADCAIVSAAGARFGAAGEATVPEQSPPCCAQACSQPSAIAFTRLLRPGWVGPSVSGTSAFIAFCASPSKAPIL